MKYCIDTNVLFSFQKGIDLGNNPEEVMRTLLKSAQSGVAQFVFPKSITDEMYQMLESAHHPLLASLLAVSSVISPEKHTHSISVGILYDFVNENRKRAYDGMKIAEEIMGQVAKDAKLSGLTDRIAFEKSLQPYKESFRARYRNATRTGFLDSEADLDLIILAKQEGATLVSADEGLLLWGRKFGIQEMHLPVFGQSIKGS